MRYNPQKIETCIVQCLRQCSINTSFRDVIVRSLRGGPGSWSEDLNGFPQKMFILVVRLVVEIINTLQVCPDILRDEPLRSNV